MAKIWKNTCKVQDCGKEFGYSDYSLQQDLARNYNRPERCLDCRKSHGNEVSKIAHPFFQLKPRKDPPPILGLPYLGCISRGDRILKDYDTKQRLGEMQINIPEKEVERLYKVLRNRNHQVVILEGPTGCGKSSFVPYRLIEPLIGQKDELKYLIAALYFSCE